ncbi:16095_t:CDS:1, partial [Cetraspora pellucida]
AMKWIKIAWEEVSTKTIRSCWLRTKTITSRDDNGVPIIPPTVIEGTNDIEENPPVDPNDELIIKELQQQINMLQVRNPMPIEDLLNPEEEREIHQQFTDEDLIHGATEIEEAEDEFVMLPLTGEEQLNILRGALRIVDERVDDGGVTLKFLRKLQNCIREE